MRHLSGRTLKPASGKSFVTEWILSVAVIRANPSRQQGKGLAKRTPATSGLSFKGQLGLFDQDTASLRTSKDILPSGLKTSCTTWESWVTSLRQEYSVRLKSAHLTREKEFSSWPTATARDWKGCGNAVQRKDGKHRMDTLEAVALFGPPAPENTSTSGKSQELWATPRAEKTSAENLESWEKRRKEGKVSQQPLPTQVQNWPTPNTMDVLPPRDPKELAEANRTRGGRKNRQALSNLREAVNSDKYVPQNWPTPDTQNHRDGTVRRKDSYGSHGVSLHHKIAETNKPSMKLNPSWVEQLQGLPVGWTQLPTGWIDSDCSETELSPIPAK